jgi:hypothetical protein
MAQTAGPVRTIVGPVPRPPVRSACRHSAGNHHIVVGSRRADMLVELTVVMAWTAVQGIDGISIASCIQIRQGV